METRRSLAAETLEEPYRLIVRSELVRIVDDQYMIGSEVLVEHLADESCDCFGLSVLLAVGVADERERPTRNIGKRESQRVDQATCNVR